MNSRTKKKKENLKKIFKYTEFVCGILYFISHTVVRIE